MTTMTASQNEHPSKYEDPDIHNPARKGMLLSNEIEKFCKNGLLIEDYKTERLRPASYTLTIGSDYVDSAGKVRRLTQKKPFFEIEPNSIVYVSTAEKLNLPFYIAARFNLRVKWVYKGILLGTGPQVEPGYKGYLSCPLYNLTNRPIRVWLGDEFATIDFERTTDFCKGKKWKEIEPFLEKGEKLDTVVVDTETFLLFKQEQYKPLKHLPEYDIVSSLVQMSNEVKMWRHIGIGIVIAFIALALTLLGFGSNLYREMTSNTRDLAQSVVEINRTKDGLANTQEQLSALKSRIALLDKEAERGEKKAR